MNKKLLIDTILFIPDKQQIDEAIKDGKTLIVSGPVQRADAKNFNGRSYPKSVLEREVVNYKNTFIKERRALGELDHPESSVVTLGNTSHNVLDVWWENDDVMAKIEILTTPAGNILKELLRSGIRLGISSRGLGSVRENEGTSEVQDDFELICWDFVSNPSTPGAFMNKVVNESIENKQTNKYKKINDIISEILGDFNVTCNSKSCKIKLKD